MSVTMRHVKGDLNFARNQSLPSLRNFVMLELLVENELIPTKLKAPFKWGILHTLSTANSKSAATYFAFLLPTSFLLADSESFTS